MNIRKRKVYIVPEVRIVEGCQENLMNLSKWNTGSSVLPIIPGNPPDGGSDSSPYAKWHGFNAWEDDIKY